MFRIVFRKALLPLLPLLAGALLAGCATDYTYRGGSGDYYYGRPQVEYRGIGPYGASGFGGWFGYGYGWYGPYGTYGYGYPYGYYGSPYWGPWYPRPPHRPRPGHDGTPGPAQGNTQGNTNGDHRPPPWRDLQRMAPRERGDEAMPRARYREPAPQRAPAYERPSQLPSMRDPGVSGSPMGRAMRGARSRSAGSGE